MAIKGPATKREPLPANSFSAEEIALFSPLFLKCKAREITAKEAYQALNVLLIKKGYSEVNRQPILKKFVAYGKAADNVLRAEQTAKKELEQATREAEQATREREQATREREQAEQKLAKDLQEATRALEELKASEKQLQSSINKRDFLVRSINESHKKIAAAKKEAEQNIAKNLQGVSARRSPAVH